MKHKFFTLLPHTADKKLLIYGKDLKELFEHGALAISHVLKDRVPKTRAQRERKREIRVEAPALDLLFADFLQEVVKLADIHNEIYPKVEIKELSDDAVHAHLYGVAVKGFDEDIKAVTYNDLFVKEEKGKWIGQVVIDV
ncbi:MAG: archease [Candidatus Portnoybacteria bacterium]|nr:archease [Candidatus Portnoybacteria bacterium]